MIRPLNMTKAMQDLSRIQLSSDIYLYVPQEITKHEGFLRIRIFVATAGHPHERGSCYGPVQ